jgi:phage terminase large subunit-like protein
VIPERVDDPAVDLGRLLTAAARKLGAETVDEMLARQRPPARAAAHRAVGTVSAAGWRSSPDAMAVHLTASSPTPMKPWRYVKLLGDAFRRAVTGESPRQIWNLPARYGKSTMASQWGPAWALDRDPSHRIGLTSYGDLLALRNARAVQDIVEANASNLHVRLRKNRKAAGRFETPEGGGIIAAGVGSALTGIGLHGLVVDDPFKNWQEAHSENKRQTVWDWYRAVARLRLESDDAWIIVCMTRWHEEDLSGMLEAQDIVGEGEGWEVVRLPAIAETPDLNSTIPSMRLPDPLGRAPGEVLEPERFSVESVKARATALGSYLAAGLEQQRPAPAEGGEIMRAWWQWADAAPPRFDDSLTSWDMKLKDKTGGDYVVGQTWGRTGSDYWAVDQLRGQWNLVTTKTAIALMAVRHPKVKRHIIENTGNGPEVIDQLRSPQKGYVVAEEVASALGMTRDERTKVQALMRRGMSGIIPENPKGDKVARVRAQTPLIEAGNVHLLERDWATSLVNEAASFPRGAHDDQVDAMSQALKRLAKGPASTRAPSGTTSAPKRDRQIGQAATGTGNVKKPRVNRATISRAPSRQVKPNRSGRAR